VIYLIIIISKCWSQVASTVWFSGPIIQLLSGHGDDNSKPLYIQSTHGPGQTTCTGKLIIIVVAWLCLEVAPAFSCLLSEIDV